MGRRTAQAAAVRDGKAEACTIALRVCTGRPPRPPPPVRMTSAHDDDMTTTNHMVDCEQWRPVAYITVQDDSARARIISALDRMGWAVVTQPTGFHLVQAISGVIDGHRGWLRPGLIVIDAWSRGCAGTTIAAGLRDLGIAIPIVLVAAPGEALPVSSDATLRIVDTASVERAVTELAAGQRLSLLGPLSEELITPCAVRERTYR